jgi:hypothetical protein
MLRVVLYKKTQLIDGEIATLQARTSTMSSVFDKRTQPLKERMEIVRLQERYKTSTRISKLTIRDMTTELKELKAKLTTYEVEVGRLQAKIMQGDSYCGRNSTHFSKSVSWGSNDGANNEVVTQFCKNKLFLHYKFLHQGWLQYSADDTLSLCYKIFKIIEVPLTVTTLMDKEFYWKTKILPMINKKLCEMRSNFNSAIKERYLGKFTGRLLCRYTCFVILINHYSFCTSQQMQQ